MKPLALAVLLLAPAALAAGDRPNILFAFADDWGRYASAYAGLPQEYRSERPGDVLSGMPGFATPNFDRVAQDGVLFTNAFVNAPSCTPCRSSLLSGQYFWRTGRGAILNGAVWDETIPSWPLLLEDAGYHLGQTYKVWSPGTPADAPYGRKRTAYESAGGLMNRFSQTVTGAEDRDAAKARIFAQVRENFRRCLADREDGQPFSYWFGPTNVHRTWVEGSGKELWGLDPDDLEGRMPAFLPDVPAVREDFADYLGEVMAFDAALGVILDELEASGEAANTLVAVSGDHGAPGFPRGKTNLYDFGTAVPLAVRWPGRVPAGPPGKPRVVTDFTTLPDLAPTFLEAAGVAVPDVMTASGLLPVLTSANSGRVDPSREFAITGRERHVAAARTDYLPYPQRAVRTDRFLYVRNFAPDRWPQGTAPGYGEPGDMPPAGPLGGDTRAAFADVDASPTKAWMILHRDDPAVATAFALGFLKRPGEELYDLSADPDQVTNVADDPRFADAKAELANRLLGVLRETGDPRVTGAGDAFDRPPYSGKVDKSRRP